MPVVSVSEAAAALGFKSRSAIYRLKNEGQLSAYLRPPASTGGAERLELEPKDLPPLREHVARLIRVQRNNADRQQARPRTDSRWGLVAAALGEALEDCGGLELTGPEAQAIAAALPEALAEAWGDCGLEWLRGALWSAGCWWAGAPTADDQDAEHWQETGRWEPTAPPLDGDELWEHVAQILGANLLSMVGCTPVQAVTVWDVVTEAVRDVRAGARWDQQQRDRYEAGLYLEDLEHNPGAADSLASLSALLEAGRLPDDLAAEAREALAQAEQQAPAALPVVVSD